MRKLLFFVISVIVVLCTAKSKHYHGDVGGLIPHKGICGPNFTWKTAFDDNGYGVLTIQGKGVLDQECSVSSPLHIDAIVFDEGITSVSTSFQDWKFLEFVGIGSTLESLDDVYSMFHGTYDFLGFNVSEHNPYFSSIDGVLFNKNQSRLIRFPQSRFETYTIPDTVEIIEDHAFADSRVLDRLNFGSSVKKISDYAFENCDGLSLLNLPDSLESVAPTAFDGCTYLRSLHVSSNNQYFFTDSDGVLFDKNLKILIRYPPARFGDTYTILSSVNTIGQNAFMGAKNLETITIPNSVVKIEDFAFAQCNQLTSVSIPYSVKYMTGYAFSNCAVLESIKVDAKNMFFSSIEDVLYDKNGTTLLQYPCGREPHYTIPDKTEEIGEFAFGSCKRLNSVTVPKSVKYIDNGAFSQCVNLQTVNIPDRVESLDQSVFDHCISLKTIYVEKTHNNFSSIQGVLFNKDETELIAYPCAKGVQYDVPESVTSISLPGFSFCETLKEVSLGSKIESFSNDVFRGCSGLENVGVSKNNLHLVSINGVVFDKSEKEILFFPFSLGSIYTIPNSVKTIGSSVFQSNPNLVSLTISESVTHIADYAFNHCSQLKYVKYFGIEDPGVGSRAPFLYNSDLSNICVPPNYTSTTFCGEMELSGLTRCEDPKPYIPSSDSSRIMVSLTIILVSIVSLFVSHF